MRISVAEAENRLTELIRLAAQGENVVVIQENGPAIRLAIVDEPSRVTRTAVDRSKLIARLQEEVRLKKLVPDSSAAHSQDFLYDEFGLPK